MTNTLPITRIKIGIAKILYRVTKLILLKRDNHINVKRKGIWYALDLSEGIDLSIFWFGGFQKHVTQSKYHQIPADATILDVGGNSGTTALQFATIASKGQVYSFEPTHYALNKFKKNLSLNKELAKRINVINTFVSDDVNTKADLIAYSSWKVDASHSGSEHPVHLGTAKSTDNVGSITLDEFCKSQQIKKVDFIKIDTDGHEFKVLLGAKKMIETYQPQIIFEVGQYVMEEKNIDFSFYLNYFGDLHYQLYDSKSEKAINEENCKTIIPKLGTTDIIAIPSKK